MIQLQDKEQKSVYPYVCMIQLPDKEGAMNFNPLVPSHSHLYPQNPLRLRMTLIVIKKNPL